MDQAENLRNIIKKNSEPKERLARVITVTSGKGGVGKTTVTVNLALQLARLGNRVIILDADFGLANIEVMLGIRPQYTLADVMLKGMPLKDVITAGPEGIGFLSGGSGIRELANMKANQIESFVKHLYELDKMADVVIIDTGAGISDTVMEFVVASSEVLVVATPEPTSITDAYSLLKTLKRKPGFNPNDINIKMIGNRVRKHEEGVELFEKLSVVVKKFLGIDIELIGMISYDEKCQMSVMKQSPVSLEYPTSPSSKAFRDMAMLLSYTDGDINFVKPKGIKTLFSNVIRLRTKN
ncbi:MAG: MinD/ParA family protein [Lachnospiraceae bacterium]|nr:MinD/ParA family protein [Lachnospiraceae bacterium]